MDCRNTLAPGDSFATILRNCADTAQKVALLLDDNGLTRAEGLIQSMELEAADPYIKLADGKKISCSTIVAINGVFLDDYSQC